MQAAAGNTDEAIATVRRAQEVLGAIDNRDLLGDAYDHEAYVYLMLNRENDAAGAYRKAADLFEQDGNSLKEASTLRAIARIEMKNKNYDVAHDLLEKCRNLYRENGDLLGEASALSAIGYLRYIIRDIENARKALMKSVYLYGKVAHHLPKPNRCCIWHGSRPMTRNTAILTGPRRIISVPSNCSVFSAMTT